MENINKVSKLRNRYEELIKTMKVWNLYYPDDEVDYELQLLSEEIAKRDAKLNEEDKYCV